MNSNSQVIDAADRTGSLWHKFWIIFAAIVAAAFFALRAPCDHVVRVSWMTWTPEPG